MKRLSFLRKMVAMYAIMITSSAFAEIPTDVRSRLDEGYKAPSYNTNFPSEQLFSIADIGRKTYRVLGSKSLRLTRSGIYDPISEALGSPMIQIAASTVIIDLNGSILTKNIADTEVRVVGIEIGYSPAAILADTTLSLESQPKNVIIRNGTLDNFDVGCVIHEGVKSVQFEDITFTRTPVAIVGMGSLNDPDAGTTDAAKIASCSFKNVRILGAFYDESGATGALEWSRNKIETANSSGSNGLGFNYGANTYMNRTNPVNSNDASVYSGIVLRYCNNILLEGISIDSIGYRGNDTYDTVTCGIDIQNSENLFLDGINISSCISPAEVIACNLNGCSSVSIKNSVFSNNLAQRVSANTSGASRYRRAIGLYLQSVHTAMVDSVVCNANQANSVSDSGAASRARAYGLLWETGVALDLKNVSCDHNEGNAGFCYGLKFDAVESVSMDGISADYNHGTGGSLTAGDDETDANNMGVTGIAFSSSLKVLNLSNVTVNSNYGSSIIGLRIFAGEGLHISNFQSNYSSGTDFVKGMAFNSFVKSCVLDGISVVSNTSSNGVVNGITFTAAQSVDVKDMICNYNTTSANNKNVLALDFATSAKTITMQDIQVSSNAAHGNGTIGAVAMASGQDILLSNFQASSNTGGGDSTIMNFSTAVQTLRIDGLSINSNAITHATNGLTALLLASPVSVDINNLTIGSNSTSAAGAMYGLKTTTSARSVKLQNLMVNSNTSGTGTVRGFSMTAPAGLLIKDSAISGNKNSGTGTTAAKGLELLTSATSVTLVNTSVSGTVATGAGIPAHGIYIESPVDLMLQNVACDTTAAAGAAIGVELATSVKSVTLDGVSVNYTTSSGSTAQAIVMTAAENVVIKDTRGSHTVATSGNVEGLKIATSAKSVSIENSAFNSNAGAAVSGLLIAAGQNIKLSDVSANQNTGTGGVYGMQFSSSISDLGFSAVSVNNNSSTGGTVTGVHVAAGVAVLMDGVTINNNTSSGGNAIGMNFATSADTVTLKNMSIDNVTSSSSAGTAQGLLMVAPRNVTMENLSANHVASTHGTPGDVQGIYLSGSARAINMTNVASNSNAGAAVHGFKIDAAQNIFMQDCFADQNSGTDAVYGIEFLTSVNSVDAVNLTANANSSTGGVVGGLKMTDAVAVNIDGLAADYNQAAGATNEVVGVDFASSVSSLSLKDVTANNNTSDAGNATGIRLVSGLAVFMDGVSANYNKCADDQIVRGIHCQTSLQSSHLNNLIADSNYAANPTTDMIAVGITIEQPLSMEINNASASRNLGYIRSYGLFLDGQEDRGSNIFVKNGVFNGNAAAATATVMSAIDDSSRVSRHLPVHVQDDLDGFGSVLEGGFGVYVYDVNSCSIESVDASKNSGMRAGGIYVDDCDDLSIQDSKTSFNAANGDYFFDGADTFDGHLNTALVIPLDQVDTLFGGIIDTTVDLIELIKDLLHGLRNTKSLLETGYYDPTLNSVYTVIKEVAGGQLLMDNIMAQFRRFSTAVGVQIHDSENCVVADHLALGNKSVNDSAIGIGFSGTALGHIVLRAKCSSNEAWTASEIDDQGSININQTLPFWTFVNTYVLKASWNGEQLSGTSPATYTQAISSPIIADQLGFAADGTLSYHEDPSLESIDQPQPVAPLLSEPVVANNRLAIMIAPSSGNYADGSVEEFCSVVGGMAVGILVGDAAVNCVVDSCDCANNQANAGRHYGILQMVTTSLLVKDNRMYQATANHLGYGFGIAEITLQSNSVHIGNVMFGNSVGDYLNFNHCVCFNPEDYPNIFFPLVTIYNGDMGNAANMSPFDNMEIKFIALKQTLPYMPNDMLDYWEESTGSKDTWTN
jgi:hypothetical protein